jgi:hypothetical protein
MVHLPILREFQFFRVRQLLHQKSFSNNYTTNTSPEIVSFLSIVEEESADLLCPVGKNAPILDGVFTLPF